MKHIFILLLALSFLTPTTHSTAQKSEWPDLDKSPMQFAYFPSNAAWRNYLEGENRNIKPKIRVRYSSPAVTKRKIIGDLVPFGKEWRIGANEATEVTFYQDVEIAGGVVPAGIYTMSAIVNLGSWTINFSTQRNIWGNENRDQSKTVASVKVMAKNLDTPRERLAIGFKELDNHFVHMLIEWEHTGVAIPLAFNVSNFPDDDVSPGDMVHYPDNSRFQNYLKPEELASAKPKVQLTYSRPQMNGRKIFGELIPYGEVWRLGANESTELTLFQNVMIGGQEIRAGRYNLYAEINEKEWKFILNTDMPAWGSYNRDESKDVAMISVPVTQDTNSLEALSIIFKEKDTNTVELVVGWDKTRAALPITFK